MPYKHRRVCPICGKPNLLNLSGHLRQVHGLWNEDQRVPWLRQASHSPSMPTQAQSLSQLPIIIPPEDVHLQQLPVTKVYTSTAPPLLSSVVVNRKRSASGKRKAVPIKKRKFSKRKPIKSEKRKAKKKSSKRKVKRKLQTKSNKPRKQPVYDSSDDDGDIITRPKTRIEMQQEEKEDSVSDSEGEETNSEEETNEESDPDDIENMTLEDAFYRRPSIPSKYRIS